MNKEILTSAFRRVRLRLLAGRPSDSGDDPEDALQEAFCRVWTRRGDVSGEGEAVGLLTTAARNIRIDNSRRRNAHPTTGIEDISPHDYAAVEEGLPIYGGSDRDSREELMQEVNRLMERCLSPRDREILCRRERDGWEFDELARHYGLSEGNVRMIVSRARKTIRDVYRKRMREM